MAVNLWNLNRFQFFFTGRLISKFAEKKILPPLPLNVLLYYCVKHFLFKNYPVPMLREASDNIRLNCSKHSCWKMFDPQLSSSLGFGHWQKDSHCGQFTPKQTHVMTECIYLKQSRGRCHGKMVLHTSSNTVTFSDSLMVSVGNLAKRVLYLLFPESRSTWHHNLAGTTVAVCRPYAISRVSPSSLGRTFNQCTGLRRLTFLPKTWWNADQFTKRLQHILSCSL